MDFDLTTQQKSRLLRAYRETYAAGDQVQALKELYAKYSDLYGLAVDVLHVIVSGELKKKPDQYAALGRERAARQAAVPTPAIQREPRDLTEAERGSLIAAYRETFADPDRFAAVDRFLAQFTNIYGIPPRVLKEILALDEKCHVEEYRRLRGGFSPQEDQSPPPARKIGQSTSAQESPIPSGVGQVPVGRKKAKPKPKNKVRKSRKVAQLAVCNRKHAAWEYCSACEGHNTNVKESHNSLRFEEKRGATRIVGGGLPGLGMRH